MPLLSVIVPVFNKENYMDACINSILSQSFKDLELILVNDGSSDRCGEKCDFFEKKDSRVKVVHQLNRGVSFARNIGVKLSKGSFIGFADADDLLEKDMYEILIKEALKTNADVTVCGVKKIFPNKQECYYGSGRVKTFDKLQGLSAFFKKDIAHSVNDKIYKSNIAKNISFQGSINEDIFFNFLAFQKSKKIVFNDIIKYNYIIRENSVSMSAFNTKYMDTILFSNKMLEICKNEIPELINEAKLFDLVANISLLNIILLNNKDLYPEEFSIVTQNLNNYSNFIDKSIVSIRHKYAFRLFRLNVSLYATLMKVYCKIFDAEALKRA